MTDHSIGRTSEGPQMDQLPQFDDDAQDWYIEQCAHEQGLNPYETLREVRMTQRKRARVERMLGSALAHDNAVTLVPAPIAGGITTPPGFTGDLVRFVYASAPRPVTEVAIVAALGLLAGVCGRQWYISGTGLNIYLVLVARSGIGKEAMHRGISKLIHACRKQFPNPDRFVSFDDYASGPALIKGCLASLSFVNVVGELGHKFYAMANAKDNDASRSLRRVMTNLYSKSGPGAIAGGVAYSNQDNNAKIDVSVAYSLVGETTPAKLYESLTADMMSDGFLSRFNVMEYAGDRPEKNPAPLEQPSDALVQHLVGIMQQAQTLLTSENFQPVQTDDAAAAQLEAFERECDGAIREAGDDEARRQMWNRAALKAMRIAALLAVADNHLFPLIMVQHVEWAIQLVRHDISVFSKRLSSGDVGEATDDARERKLLQIMREYLASPPLESYKVPENLRPAGIIPRFYIQRRIGSLPAFRNHKLGSVKAMEDALRSLASSGFIHELKDKTLEDSYGFHGKAYAVRKLE